MERSIKNCLEVQHRFFRDQCTLCCITTPVSLRNVHTTLFHDSSNLEVHSDYIYSSSTSHFRCWSVVSAFWPNSPRLVLESQRPSKRSLRSYTVNLLMFTSRALLAG